MRENYFSSNGTELLKSKTNHDLEESVSIRRIPYPYRAMMAICSDLDETPDRHVFFETARFLNTTEKTSIGHGVGLEIGNTIYFDMPPSQFSYWNTDDFGRSLIRDMICSGHIDCLHSFGDLTTTRKLAGKALEELIRHGCRLEVWVDHGTAITNFGEDIMQGMGDAPESPAYHADLTLGFGVQFVWRGRITSIIGQDIPPYLSGIVDFRHPARSIVTLSKEAVKGLLARMGNTKYAMHGSNRVMRKVKLRDGQWAFEFIRSNPHWRGVSYGEIPGGFPDVLTRNMLDLLVEREGVCILYTHLGKVRNRTVPFDPPIQAAFRLLAEYYCSGKILVATTRRLLGMLRATKEVALSVSREGEYIRINLGTDSDGTQKSLAISDIGGLSVYTPDPSRTIVMLNGKEIDGLLCNPPDDTGRSSVSLPLVPLVFPF
jgi:hypothetical protein